MNIENKKPFTCKVSNGLSQFLFQNKLSIALSTYQAGKMLMVSAVNEDKLVQLPRTFNAPMGIAYNGKQMAIACKNEVVHLVNSPEIISANPKFTGKYDAMFLPRQMYMTGSLALHDMAYTKKGLVAVNTQFSCLSMFDGVNSFKPIWKPDFISTLEPEDRCHLNGMATENGMPKYVTALGSTDTAGGWRDNKINGGILMEVPSGRVITDGLSMPHSPRLINGKLVLLNSAQGEIMEVNPETGEKTVLQKTGTFLRGMSQFGDYLFIGSSKLRHKNEVFRGLPIADTTFAGLIVVQISTMKEVARLQYETSVDEIYDVAVLPNMQRPGIMNCPQAQEPLPIINDKAAFWAEPEEKQKEYASENSNK
jgi:uncharacterized protein (TIGR03032 family)